MPGWDEWCRETTRRFSAHGYMAICPDIYSRFGKGKPAEIAAKARNEGMVHDDSVMGDTKASLDILKAQPLSNRRAGVIGMCSGGRHAFLAACTIPGFDAVVDCWGGGVVLPQDNKTPARPVTPIDYTAKLNIPLLGIFGNDDQHPSPEEVDTLEAELKKQKKNYEFHRYDGAGHGIWYYDKPLYRQEQAMDSWEKVAGFFDKYLK
jgi:carboxymethylenebutenolidase